MKIHRRQRKPNTNAAPACKPPRIPASYSIQNEPTTGHSLPLRFAALLMVLLACSSLCLFFLAQWLILPGAQVGSLPALPAYNIAGQQNDQASFWTMARYHDLPPTTFKNQPFFAVDALSRLDSHQHLEQIMQSGGMCSLRAAEGATTSFWNYDDLLQEVSCQFIDDISCTYSDATGREIPGVVNLSMGWSSGFLPLPVCYTALFQPRQRAEEEAFEKAYASLVNDLQLLCSGSMNTFHSVETMLSTVESEPFEDAGMTAQSAESLAELSSNMAYALSDLYQTGTFPVDQTSSEDPKRTEVRLQEYCSQQGLSLQILRLEEFYLLLLDNGSYSLGLYYSPVLETWCGLGLQDLGARM